ncbi:hypothetical protein JO972_14005 [Verrucomicrobiaceae bacterium 5K15]|uniref:Uncharacterized protein n=1 Tax=Oceaniferula flava TaxID=2800421 RepID=A0AAE2SD81_9BACT|nr:hypothetical protein [Oceaniferula flavus]MBK1856081.1 hypothetical protein [Oceaniferula flavus]MBM1137388.1 hypothetical protein [Oceaniferula flavus]
MALNEPWSIKSRAHTCSVTEKKFTDGETFYTALYPDPESSGYIRRDFSEDAWDSLGADADQPFSFWGSVYHAPVKEETVEVTEESPEDLLRRLVEEDEEHTESVRYILAVMLERKKQLVEADSQHTPTGILRIYEHRKSGDVFIVKDPNIPLSEIDSVQQDIADLLESGGRKKAEEEPQETDHEENESDQNVDSEPTEAKSPEPTASSDDEAKDEAPAADSTKDDA